MPITGIEAAVDVDGNKKNKMITGPAVRLLDTAVEYQPGDPKRLIGGKGSYTCHVAITMHRNDIPDVAMVLLAGEVALNVIQ